MGPKNMYRLFSRLARYGFPTGRLLLVIVTILTFSEAALAQTNRGVWMWGSASHPYGASNVIGDLAKESELISYFGAWGVDRVYASVGATPISDPTSKFSADFATDSKIDGADFLAWQQGYGTNTGATLAEGDANGNGSVNAFDLAVWEQQFGVTPLLGVAAIPEPSSCLLAIVGLLGLLFPIKKIGYQR